MYEAREQQLLHQQQSEQRAKAEAEAFARNMNAYMAAAAYKPPIEQVRNQNLSSGAPVQEQYVMTRTGQQSIAEDQSSGFQ
jgi:hypothetical protein